ncbi:MAG: heme exporter protein CcmD [Magnetospirillum sp.]|nr:heme exporter protein CcmD [Magnetospirillum sp.]
MDAIRAFLAMGGYGAFVWPGYLLALVVLAGLLAVSLKAARAREAELDILQRGRHRAGRRGVSSGE